MVAQSWLVYQLTGSALLLGVVSFIQAIPAVFLSLVGGVLADQVERRRLMIVTQTGSMVLAFLLAALTLLHVVQVWHIMVIAFLAGLVTALNTPVRQGIVSDLVPREDLQNAIGINSAQFQSSRLFGPALAGLVVAQVGAGWAFFANGLSFLAVIASLLMLKLPPWRPQTHREPFLKSATTGVQYVFRHDILGILVLAAAVPAFFAMSYQTLLPVFAQDLLHTDAQGLGFLFSGSGAGALLGALGVASLTGFRRRGLLQLVALVLFGSGLVLFALSHNLVLSVVLLMVTGLGSQIFNSINQTFLQTLAPDALRGRILSVLTLTTFGVMPFGNLVAGALAQQFGPTLVLALGGSITALFALGVVALRPTVRRLE